MLHHCLYIFTRRSRQQSLCKIQTHVAPYLSKYPARNYLSVPKDVLLYENNTPGLLRLVGLCGLSQWLVITYMSSVMYQTMPSFFTWIPAEKASAVTDESKPISQRLPLAEWKYRFGFSLFTFTASTAILFTSFMYCLRTVSTIRLLHNSNKVYISTYTPLGTKQAFIEKLSNISAIQPRHTPMTQVPIKIKDRYFHFLLDKSGKFPQPSIYDRTVGIKRDFGIEKK